MSLKDTFHLSPCHQAGLGAVCGFLFCENLLVEIKILDVFEKMKVVLIMTKICVLSLLTLSCFLKETGEKASYLGYMLQMNDMEKQLKKRDLIPSCTGLGVSSCFSF